MTHPNPRSRRAQAAVGVALADADLDLAANHTPFGLRASVARPAAWGASLVLSLALGSRLSAGDADTSGYRGDRNGYYAGGNPPTTWNDHTGKNIAWRTQLPNWCYGQPIVVGDRVFVMSEPGWKSDFPELVCVDTHTGKILWQKEINHLSCAIPDELQRRQVAAAWHSLLERMRMTFRMFHRTKSTLLRRPKTASDEDDEPELNACEAILKETAEKAKALGWLGADETYFMDMARLGGGYGTLRGWGGEKPGIDARFGLQAKDLHQYGLRLETCYGFGHAREGECFPTPCSDGKAVYVVTEQGAHACFDLDGKLKWLTWIKPTFNPGWGHDGSICRSPLVCDGLFITDLHTDYNYQLNKQQPVNSVIALDTSTGRVVWETYLPPKMDVDSSKVMEIAGQKFFINCEGRVLRIRDGAHVFSLAYIYPGPACAGPEFVIDDSTDTLFHREAGGDLVAVKLVLQGETMTEEEVWRTKIDSRSAGYTMVLYRGKIYTGGGLVDTATGRVAKWGEAIRNPTRWLLAIAGDRLYTLAEDVPNVRGPCRTTIGKAFTSVAASSVFDLSGRRLATNILLTPPAGTREMIDQRIETIADSTVSGDYRPEGGWIFSYSRPFTFSGDSMYVRSMDELICIRDGGGAGPRKVVNPISAPTDVRE